MILGIDTSNYTTSIAACENGSVIFDERILLSVKKGERGLRQSEAFFQHVKNLPVLIKRFDGYKKIKAVCVSKTPRRVEGSYMPCFLAGSSFADTLAHVLDIPLYSVSHQEGHIRAALCGSGIDETRPFLCAHLSGGTTEILLCKSDRLGYSASIVANSCDISAGQFIDRVGVACGLSFPCGAEMNELIKGNASFRLPISVKNDKISFSGVETKICRMIKEGIYEKEEIFSAVFSCVAESLIKAVKYCAKLTGAEIVLFAGGVSASNVISNEISKALSPYMNVEFASARLSSDNACGVALLGERFYKGGKF